MLETLTKYSLCALRPFAVAAHIIAAHPHLALGAWLVTLLVALWW